MAKNEGQKLKLIYLLDILKHETDDEYGITMGEIIEKLQKHGVKAERKSIYNDLQTLEDYGADIMRTRDSTTRYSLASREFELPELKLLVDAVQSSKFLSVKKSRELISKLENLTSKRHAALLHRQVYVTNRVKSMNESLYYNIDAIHSAIAENKQIEFKYFNWDVNKQKELKYNGKTYKTSPYALVWDNAMYYLVAFDEQLNAMRHYRVDKMQNITSSKDNRLGKQAADNLDMAVYTQATFGMFSGNPDKIELEFKDYLAGAVIDRFGNSITIIPTQNGVFRVHVSAVISPQFFGFLSGFGADVKIIAPKKAVRQYKSHCEEILRCYDV